MPPQNTLTQHISSLGANSRHQRNRGSSTQKQQGQGSGHCETFYVDKTVRALWILRVVAPSNTSLPGESS